jgi:hypothetical protein
MAQQEHGADRSQRFRSVRRRGLVAAGSGGSCSAFGASMKPPRFKVGDTVKLTGIPPQVDQDQRRFPETLDIFQKAVGRTFRVRGVDEYGHIELWLCYDGSEDERGVSHSIWVEPDYLAVS